MGRIDPKTLRAAAMADGFTSLTIIGMGLFLGFSWVPVVVTGLVAGTLMAALIVAASLRADTFAPTAQTDHLRLDDQARGLTSTDTDEADDRG